MSDSTMTDPTMTVPTKFDLRKFCDQLDDLSPSPQLWQVAFAVVRGKVHRSNGRKVEADRMRAKAEAMARKIMDRRIRALLADKSMSMVQVCKWNEKCCQEVRAVLHGELPRVKPDKVERLLEGIIRFYEEHGHLPTSTDLYNEGFRSEEIMVVKEAGKRTGEPIIAEGQRGPKPKGKG